MVSRATPANLLISYGRSLGRRLGAEMAVELSDHSIKTEMKVPDRHSKGWDPSLYKHGNIFMQGYANPIKPRVKETEGLVQPDEIEYDEGDGETDEDEDGEVTEDDRHIQLVSSGLYRLYMIQDLADQLLTPEEQWRKIMYVVLALAFLMIANIFISLSAAGLL